jgi:hypothetical protein
VYIYRIVYCTSCISVGICIVKEADRPSLIYIPTPIKRVQYTILYMYTHVVFFLLYTLTTNISTLDLLLNANNLDYHNGFTPSVDVDKVGPSRRHTTVQFKIILVMLASTEHTIIKLCERERYIERGE